MSRNSSLAGWCGRPSDWSLYELSIFDIACRSLNLQGFCLRAEQGITDEGAPWLVFFDESVDDVFCHFARIGDEYVACVPFHSGGTTGRNLAEVVNEFLLRLVAHVRLFDISARNGAAENRRLDSH